MHNFGITWKFANFDSKIEFKIKKLFNNKFPIQVYLIPTIGIGYLVYMSQVHSYCCFLFMHVRFRFNMIKVLFNIIVLLMIYVSLCLCRVMFEQV